MTSEKRGKGKSQWLPVCVVRSDSDPSKSYTIALNAHGQFGCSCPSWIYQRGPQIERKDCIHLKAQADVLQALGVRAVEQELREAAQQELFNLAREEERALQAVSDLFANGLPNPQTMRAERAELRKSGLRVMFSASGKPFIVKNKAGETVAAADTEREAIDAANYALKS